jgi:hypothetical protein
LKARGLGGLTLATTCDMRSRSSPAKVTGKRNCDDGA